MKLTVCIIMFSLHDHRLITIVVLSNAVDGLGDAFAPVRALRQVLHERLTKDLFEHEKDAMLRSGARGMTARKALIVFEKKFAVSAERYDILPPINQTFI